MQCGPANQNFGWAMAHLAHAAALPPHAEVIHSFVVLAVTLFITNFVDDVDDTFEFDRHYIRHVQYQCQSNI